MKSNPLAAYTAEDKKDIITQLSACQAVQRTYGKQAEDIPAVCRIFLADLADFPPAAVVQAIADWRKRHQEFPTPSDIRGILSPEPTFSADLYRELLRKRKDPGEWLSDDERRYLRRFEANMMKGV